MRYSVKIKYHTTEMTINLSFKPAEKNYVLPDFLKFVRERAGDPIHKVHIFTDYPPQQCKDMENGDVPITKHYLELFALMYNLPRKIAKLGMDTGKSTLANRICTLRVSSGQTQKEVSDALGIAQTTYAGYETGRNEPDVNMLIRIAEMYNVSLDFLCGRY